MISKSIHIMQGMPRSLSNNKPLETTSKYGKGNTINVTEDASSLDVVSPESRNDTVSTIVAEEDISSHNNVSTGRSILEIPHQNMNEDNTKTY